jgi:hypothetical protein
MKTENVETKYKSTTDKPKITIDSSYPDEVPDANTIILSSPRDIGMLLPFKDQVNFKQRLVSHGLFKQDVLNYKIKTMSKDEYNIQMRRIHDSASIRYGETKVTIYSQVNRLVFGRINSNKLDSDTRISLLDVRVVKSRKKKSIVDYVSRNCHNPYALLSIVRLNWQFLDKSSPWVLLEWCFETSCNPIDRAIFAKNLQWINVRNEWDYVGNKTFYLDAFDAIEDNKF